MATPGTGDSDYLGRGAISVFLKIFVGSVLGFLAGLGIGGGSLLVLWLTVVVGTDPQTARCINLMFFLPAALISCVFRKKQGKLELKQLLPAMLAGCIAAGIFSFLGINLVTSLLKKLFGGLLLLTGFRELFCGNK